MTNGELFIKENPTVEIKINGSCVWIYFDGVNHYTMPTLWWEQEIGLFEDIKAEIKELPYQRIFGSVSSYSLLDTVIEIIDKHMERGRINEADN